MQDSQSPTKVPTPWGSAAGGAYINPIPTASQIGIANGRASWTDGFVPLNFTPVSAGGVPPFGGDVNGGLNQISAGVQWLQAGAPMPFDSVFSAAIGGYPKGALIASLAGGGFFWYSLVDNNTSNPDAGGANWALIGLLPLQTATTYYVNPVTGSDGNNGLTTGTAWATLTHAYRWLQQNVNANGQTITIECAFPTNPTPYAAFNAVGGITGVFAPNQLMIVGDNSGKTCQISLTAANGVCLFGQQGAQFQASGFTLQSTGTNGVGVAGSAGSQILYGNMNFEVFGAYGVEASGSGTIVGSIFNTTLTFAGNCESMFEVSELATMHVDTTTVNSSLTVSSASVAVADGALFTAVSSTFGGSGVTGSRFNVSMNGMIDTNGAQSTPTTNYLPGTTAGTQATGGEFR